MNEFVEQYLRETKEIIDAVDQSKIADLASHLARVRDQGGRLFILGVGGSAGHASHAVNDFRKICQFEAYAPTDNVSELTARTNDEGWESVFVEWLKGSRMKADDAVRVFSVGGGNRGKNLSVNLVQALDHALSLGAPVFGIVGSDDGYTAKVATTAVIVPPLYPDRRTPHSEGLTAVFWHLLVSHPALAKSPTKWESLDP